MNPTPDIDIGELRKLEKAATAGPWELLEEDGFGGVTFIPVVAGEMGTESFRHIAECSGAGDDIGATKQDELNAEFIFKFRNAAPALLARAEAKDAAYHERDMLVCALSKCFPSYLARHPAEDKMWEDDWRWIVYIELPTGQASWHIHDSERELFNHLEVRENNWDGHNTERKYQRLAALRYMPSMAMDHIAVAVLKSRLAAAEAVVSAAREVYGIKEFLESASRKFGEIGNPYGAMQTLTASDDKLRSALSTYEGKSQT